MSLADFTATNTEAILADWIDFARSLGAGQQMDAIKLRDHAAEMLGAVAADLRVAQSDAQQQAKSRGQAPLPPSNIVSAAEHHGSGRADSGFTLVEMVSQFRALRASVLRLWAEANGAPTMADFEDMVRFNEAIDQALAESAQRYARSVDTSRELFIAILGHDLRTPLAAITSSAQALSLAGSAEELPIVGRRIERSANQMDRLIGDLLDFARVRMGARIPAIRAPMHLGEEVALAVDEAKAANPTRQFLVSVDGDLNGSWDRARLHQALTNLLSNAVQHGAASSPVTVEVRGTGDEVTLTVHNHGDVLDTGVIDQLFRPFKRLSNEPVDPWESRSFGLGLYIAERIVTAHEGTIHVTSSGESGTAFTIRLPRVA